MRLTIFTPTYNRSESLRYIFEALCRQTDKRFEWLIIDDGSVDNTKECVDNFIKQNPNFNIRYYFQTHGGKHRAQNKAIDLAKGQLFITCDSNKYPADNMVELVLNMVETIKDVPYMCGVGGYRADFSGNIWGGKMLIKEEGYVDCTRLEHDKYHIYGDKATAFYTEILKKYKSPEYPNEYFVSESVWLIPMAMNGYKTRWFPEILIYGEYAKDGLTQTGANSRIGHEVNFLGFLQLIKVEREARGIKKIMYLLYEALDIAKDKKMSDKNFIEKTGCTFKEILYLRIIRICHKSYGKISSKIKIIIGKEKTEFIREKIRGKK